jgi:single-strand DNA-binding protein
MMNRVVLVGRLTKDPELKYTPNGVAVCNFTLAVNRPFKNANGDNEADFIPCQVWRKPAENTANFLSKGSLAGVDGRIQVRNFEGQDGKRVYMTEIVADSVQFLEPKKDGNGGGQQRQQQQQQSQQQNNQQSRVDNDPFANDGQPIDIADDDLPF